MMKTEITWAPGFRFRCKPEIAYQEIEKIRKKNGGIISSPGIIVRAARPRSSPIHDDCGPWNDKAAAQLWRHRRADYMLRAIRIFLPEDMSEGSEPIRAYVFIPDTDNGKSSGAGRNQGFWTTSESAARDSDMRGKLLEKARGDIKAWRNRYRQLNELATIFGVIDREIPE